MFKVGDTVKTIRTGHGIPGSRVGETTIITEVGGTYNGGAERMQIDGVKTRDFANPPYDDWIGADSFELIRTNVWKGARR